MSMNMRVFEDLYDYYSLLPMLGSVLLPVCGKYGNSGRNGLGTEVDESATVGGVDFVDEIVFVGIATHYQVCLSGLPLTIRCACQVYHSLSGVPVRSTTHYQVCLSGLSLTIRST
ncbi:hypothetical protein M8J77_012093 [Diaphorina citri]|nr:hypothetical protein M8J77_012093 [Diaphorina citri]